MFLAIDGSDQLNNGIPQFREISKLDVGQNRMKQHLEVCEVGLYSFVGVFVGKT